MSVSSQPTILVVRNALDGWDIKEEDSPTILEHFSTQEDAIQKAKDICFREKCHIFIVTQSKRIPILDFKEETD
jgi:hypothetical protein